MENIPVKEISALMDEMSTSLPAMLRNVVNVVYSAEAGKNMGQAVGNLYKELIEAGIPNEDALKMAKDYMISVKDLMNNFSKPDTNSTSGESQKNEQQ